MTYSWRMILSENRLPPPIEVGDMLFGTMRLRLLEFDQSAAKILRMQEQHRLAVGADLRLAVAEHARALRLQGVAGGADIGHLVADVVDAAVGIALEELGDWRIFSQRL